MGVIYIGDRETGKTSLAMELANPRGEYVKVTSPDYQLLKALLYDDNEGRTKPTEAAKEVDHRYLDIQVKLPTGFKQVTIDWTDTTGEIWRQTWQQNNPDKWNNFLNTARLSEGILLILPPYREILKAGVEPDKFLTQQQWCNRFNRWVDFFRYECPQARHILICLNKADLFCDLNQEVLRLAYNPNSSQMNWQQRHHYVINSRYFKPIQSQIAEINKSISGLSVRCFITSIHHRSLLELPWIYLGAYLGK
ncbi:MAG: hypothetical protein ACSI46_18270 [Gloeotrichia echinulata DVL01]|jgi:hypothetical protein|nr:hypothetical protein [Gloeotrichia echinulata DEX184]